MITVAELQSLEGSVVAVARGITAELRTDAVGAAIVFESVSGASAYVRVEDPDVGVDVLSLCPSQLDQAVDEAA